MRKQIVVFIISLIVFLLSFSHAENQHKYVGVGKCKTCHKSAKAGEQLKSWQESKHSKAYETLATAEAKKMAKEKNIADPQKAPECLKCHVTAYNVDKKYLGKKHKIEDGVGCESCHGPGGDYYKKKVMKAIYKGEQDGASLGLIKPDEKTCKTCHNPESPSFKDFNYKKRVKEITHPIPKK